MKNDELISLTRQLKAQLQGTIAEHKAVSERRRRYDILLDTGAIAIDFIEQLRSNEIRLFTSAKDLEEKLRAAEQQYQDSFIRAPFAGIITRRYAQTGEYVAPGAPTSIAELSDGIQVIAQIPESRLNSAKVGQAARITTISYPGRIFSGMIASISPRAQEVDELVSFQALIRVQDPERLLRPGMEVKIILPSRTYLQATTIPLASLVTLKNGDTGVYVEQSKGHWEFIPVKIGMVTGNRVQVLKGLKLGQRIRLSNPEG